MYQAPDKSIQDQAKKKIFSETDFLLPHTTKWESVRLIEATNQPDINLSTIRGLIPRLFDVTLSASNHDLPSRLIVPLVLCKSLPKLDDYSEAGRIFSLMSDRIETNEIPNDIRFTISRGLGNLSVLAAQKGFEKLVLNTLMESLRQTHLINFRALQTNSATTCFANAAKIACYYEAKNNYQVAEFALQKAMAFMKIGLIAEHPQQIQGVYHLSMQSMLLNTRSPATSIEVLKNAINSFSSPLSGITFGEFSDNSPELVLAKAYYTTKDLEKAKKTLITWHKNMQSTDNFQLEAVFNHLNFLYAVSRQTGDSLEVLKLHDDWLEILKKSLPENEQYKITRFDEILTNHLILQSDYVGAKKVLNNAYSRGALEISSYIQLQRFYFNIFFAFGELEKALVNINEAIQQIKLNINDSDISASESSAECYLLRSLVLAKQGKADEQAESIRLFEIEFKKVLSDPNASESSKIQLSFLENYIRGKISKISGDFTESIKYFQKAINPSERYKVDYFYLSEINTLLGDCYYELANWDNAYDHYQQAEIKINEGGLEKSIQMYLLVKSKARISDVTGKFKLARLYQEKLFLLNKHLQEINENKLLLDD